MKFQEKKKFLQNQNLLLQKDRFNINIKKYQKARILHSGFLCFIYYIPKSLSLSSLEFSFALSEYSSSMHVCMVLWPNSFFISFVVNSIIMFVIFKFIHTSSMTMSSLFMSASSSTMRSFSMSWLYLWS